MTENVLTFKAKPKETATEKEPERYIFVCHCGCRTFNMYADGNIICSLCDRELGPGEGNQEGWRKCTPDVPENVEKDETDTVNEHQLADETLARRAVMKRINDLAKSNKLFAIYAYAEDGAGHGWVGVRNEEDRQWLVRKFSTVIDWLKNMRLGDGSDEISDSNERPAGSQENGGIQPVDETQEGASGTAGDASADQKG